MNPAEANCLLVVAESIPSKALLLHNPDVQLKQALFLVKRDD